AVIDAAHPPRFESLAMDERGAAIENIPESFPERITGKTVVLNDIGPAAQNPYGNVAKLGSAQQGRQHVLVSEQVGRANPPIERLGGDVFRCAEQVLPFLQQRAMALRCPKHPTIQGEAKVSSHFKAPPARSQAPVLIRSRTRLLGNQKGIRTERSIGAAQ